MYYFESCLGHFGVFVVKLHPLLGDAAHTGLRVVDELKTCDVGATFPQVSQVNIEETLRQTSRRAQRRNHIKAKTQNKPNAMF